MTWENRQGVVQKEDAYGRVKRSRNGKACERERNYKSMSEQLSK